MRNLKPGIIATTVATTTMFGQGAELTASKYEIQSDTLSIIFFPFALELSESGRTILPGLENRVSIKILTLKHSTRELAPLSLHYLCQKIRE